MQRSLCLSCAEGDYFGIVRSVTEREGKKGIEMYVYRRKGECMRWYASYCETIAMGNVVDGVCDAHFPQFLMRRQGYRVWGSVFPKMAFYTRGDTSSS